ncbi:MAG: MBL fold metallo-hydrolase [bacterium]
MIDILKQIKKTHLSQNELGIWWLGQAGYILKSLKFTLAIDPYLSNDPRMPRLVSSPIEPENLKVDLIVCTHDHEDHTDVETLKVVNKKVDCQFLGPKNVVKRLKKIGIKKNRIIQLDVGDNIKIGNINLRSTFCIPNEEKVLDSIGMIITFENGISFYHTGDTGFHDFLFYLSKYDIDIMAICINGKLGNMGIDEAVRLTRYLKPCVVIPNHYGMFKHNNADPYEFQGKLLGSFVEPECQILEIGKAYIFKKNT